MIESNHISPYLTESCHISPNLIESHHILPNLTESDQISSDLIISHSISQNLNKSCQSWGDVFFNEKNPAIFYKSIPNAQNTYQIIKRSYMVNAICIITSSIVYCTLSPNYEKTVKFDQSLVNITCATTPK